MGMLLRRHEIEREARERAERERVERENTESAALEREAAEREQAVVNAKTAAEEAELAALEEATKPDPKTSKKK